MTDKFKIEAPTTDEIALMKLRDLITQIEGGEKPKFILIENEKAPCPCGKPNCMDAQTSNSMIYNLEPIAVAASCMALVMQTESKLR